MKNKNDLILGNSTQFTHFYLFSLSCDVEARTYGGKALLMITVFGGNSIWQNTFINTILYV